MIVCLGWGSLIWDRKTLPLRTDWFKDGPEVRAEYLRESRDGRLTLVLSELAELVPSLWSEMDSGDVNAASNALADREGMPSINRVGRWSTGSTSPSTIPGLSNWAEGRNVQHVLWTDLLPRFNGRNLPPTEEEALAYLQSLSGQERAAAENYVRMTPRQITTRFRAIFERELGWTSAEGS